MFYLNTHSQHKKTRVGKLYNMRAASTDAAKKVGPWPYQGVVRNIQPKKH